MLGNMGPFPAVRMSSLIQGTFQNRKKVPGLSTWAAQWTEADGLQVLFTDESKLPEIFSDAGFTVVLDGFLQNRCELFAEFKSPSISSNRDTDLILLAYRKWGEDLAQHLRGVYSIAIWDKKSRTLFYVRDHCGIYPAFYAIKGSQVVFSTSIADIVRHPNVGKELNRSAFVDFLCHRRPMPEETFYTEIKRVLPGHAIRFTNGAQTHVRYWYAMPEEGIQEYIPDLYSSGFEEMLENAIRRCSQPGNPAVLLSGGIDSVSIATFATKISKQDGTPLPNAISVGFPHPDFNEVEKQTEVARQLGLNLCLKHVDEIVGGRGVLRLALDFGKTWSQPMWSTWQPLFTSVGMEAKTLGARVILSGAGGDEWLNASSHVMADLIRSLDFGGMNRTIKIFLNSYKIPTKSLTRYLLWNAGARPILAEYGRRMARQLAPRTLRNLMRKRLKRTTLDWVAADPELRAATEDRVEVLVDRYMKKVFPKKDQYPFYSASSGDHFVETITSMEMEQSFESSRHIGIPLLHPYFDPDLIQLLLRISPAVLQQGGMEKGIVRTTVAKRFPDLKFETQKKASAMNYWLTLITTEGRDIYYSSGGTKFLTDSGIVDGKKIGPVMDQAFAANTPFLNAKIWDLLCLETWGRSHAS